MDKNSNLDTLKRQIYENENNLTNLVTQKRHMENAEESLHICMKKYAKICEDIKSVYQGEQANCVHEIIYEETKEGKQKILYAINREYDDNEAEQRKLRQQGKNLQDEYSIQKLKEVEE